MRTVRKDSFGSHCLQSQGCSIPLGTGRTPPQEGSRTCFQEERLGRGSQSGLSASAVLPNSFS